MIVQDEFFALKLAGAAMVNLLIARKMKSALAVAAVFSNGYKECAPVGAVAHWMVFRTDKRTGGLQCMSFHPDKHTGIWLSLLPEEASQEEEITFWWQYLIDYGAGMKMWSLMVPEPAPELNQARFALSRYPGALAEVRAWEKRSI